MKTPTIFVAFDTNLTFPYPNKGKYGFEIVGILDSTNKDQDELKNVLRFQEKTTADGEPTFSVLKIKKNKDGEIHKTQNLVRFKTKGNKDPTKIIAPEIFEDGKTVVGEGLNIIRGTAVKVEFDVETYEIEVKEDAMFGKVKVKKGDVNKGIYLVLKGIEIVDRPYKEKE